METVARKAVYYDGRWPDNTGIGNVMNSVLDRMPGHFDVHRLNVKGKVAGVTTPFHLATSLKKAVIGGVFWNPGFVPATTTKMPSVITVHDLTHLIYYGRRHKAYYDFILRPLYRKSDCIICVSEFTRDRFLDWSGMDPDRVHVIYNGVDDRFTLNKEAHKASYEYILYPGNRRAYKNIAALMFAYSRSTLPRQGVKLALTGVPDDTSVEMAKQNNIVDNVAFLGFVPWEQMPQLYKGARAIAFLSLYEGFGLPIIEGFASQVPVITSSVSAMPEVAGTAALLVDPKSIEDMTLGLEEVTFNETTRRSLVDAGNVRVKDFSWDVAAKAYWTLIDKAYDASGKQGR